MIQLVCRCWAGRGWAGGLRRGEGWAEWTGLGSIEMSWVGLGCTRWGLVGLDWEEGGGRGCTIGEEPERDLYFDKPSLGNKVFYIWILSIFVSNQLYIYFF